MDERKGAKSRLGWMRTEDIIKPVTIIESSSGCDETIIERTDLIEARMGPSDDSEVVYVDPAKDAIIEVSPSNGNGSQKVTVEFTGRGGVRTEDVYVATH